MLAHFVCERCGAQLSARPDFAGQAIPCTVCRRPVVVPVMASPPPVQPRLKRVEPDEDAAAEIALRAFEEARGIAMAEAKRATVRGRVQGVVLALIGALAGVFGAAALAFPAVLWVPPGPALVAVVFGALALLIGVAVWRLAVQTMHEEFRRRVPGIADRLRRRHWDAHRSTSPPSFPRIAVG